ncbi:starvation responsive small protein [Dictyostelium discoideum AX4]|uniref:Starvation responsive small protein A n=2 Tax=Dictyostelium discoideum TaxID=44689 RepID=SRSA_DICDI|nr:starvation responsive small protein [Dictyostelium discoideum AX4]B0G168.1 RecName: Full=Starvation responsive small protein A [Dictyostelium discoideum]EDR41041.1 starvation responsive small protein [Dictyostelium discoideum AX4]|eukprot:XP_001733031.1 starvation responsive small protein [Dictyostelium discoideum AX4]
MIAKVFKSITPESYILLVNAGLISAYGVRIIFQSVKNDEGKVDEKAHIGIGHFFKKRGAQLVDGKNLTDILKEKKKKKKKKKKINISNKLIIFKISRQLYSKLKLK